MSVKCVTTTASTYFISTEYFVDCVNKFQFSEQLLTESVIKHNLYMERIN